MAIINLEEMTPKILYSNRIPNSGNFTVGDMIVNTDPSNGIYGWVCKNSGTPGIWSALSLDGGSQSSGRSNFIGDGSSITLTINHNLGAIPSSLIATEANSVAGDAGIKYVRAFGESASIFFKNPIPDGETAIVNWIAVK